MYMLLIESCIEIYKSIFESNPNAIFILSVGGEIIEVNEVAAKIFGYSQQQLQGFHYHNIIIPDRLEEINLYFEQLLQGIPCEYETQAFHKSGEILNLKLKSVPLIFGGKIVGVFAVAKDITELQKMKTFLNGVEDTLTLFFNSTADAIYILDLNGHVMSINPSFEEIYGWNLEEVLGKALPIIPNNPFDEHNEMLVQAKGGKHFTGFETIYIKKDGTLIAVSLTFSPVRDEEGKIVGMCGIARNITKQERLERLLKESEELYRGLVELSPEPTIVYQDGRIQYANPSCIKLIGVSSLDELIGKSITDYLHPDSVHLIENRIKQIKSIGMVVTPTEEKLIRLDGTVIDLEVTGITINHEGKLAFLMMYHDISSRKRAEEALRESEEKLSHMAYHDALTGLPNRRLFKERLKQTIKEAQRYQRKFALMFMDLDNFKQINDTLSHDVGDELLKQFSKRVEDCLRESDTLARQGGDEFTILLSEIQLEQDALQIAQRIFASLQKPWQIGQRVFQTTSSIGISFYPKDGNTRHELMKHADIALYEAKQKGRNNFKTFNPFE